MNRTWRAPGGLCWPIYRDMLENQPHIMIAGATGSGKSVVINALMYTALYKFPGGKSGAVDEANSVGFILIDPKRVELADYKALPHTLRYASEPAEMVQAIQYAMDVTEDRYRIMQNQRVKEWQGSQVYVIIDEFADLMTTNKKQVQPLIQRLTQIGRAAKVHIILSTQYPIVKIVPTEIKINFNARIGLHTATAQDSRNIIGQSGCELLPRYGQGYYMTPEGVKLYNIPMIEQEELAARVKWWTDQKPKGLFARLFV